jgi:transaldolase
MSNSLEQLKKFSTVVADSAEFQVVKKFEPYDATTNPTLLLKAVQSETYKSLLQEAIQYGRENGENNAEKVSLSMNKLAVNFGLKLLQVIPGRVSTELDARFSFDTGSTIKKAKEIIDLYKAEGISKDRVLLKIASTWEGIQAAEVLENEYGFRCNMTLQFSLIQAMAAAEVGATLISPFIGRITDFYKKKMNVQEFPNGKDPGVNSLEKIYSYIKKHYYKTSVMGASFRSTKQIMQVAGCDFLTISPVLLEELSHSQEKVSRMLSSEKLLSEHIPKLEIISLEENSFRWQLNQDEMATELLAEGIRKFADDTVKLENEIKRTISK